MTLEKLLQLCDEAENRWRPEYADAPFLYLVIPVSKAQVRRLGEHIRLAKGGGPLGRVCNVKVVPGGDFEAVAVFPARRVKAFINREMAKLR